MKGLPLSKGGASTPNKAFIETGIQPGTYTSPAGMYVVQAQHRLPKLPVETLSAEIKRLLTLLSDKLNKHRSLSLSEQGMYCSPLNNLSVPVLCLHFFSIL